MLKMPRPVSGEKMLANDLLYDWPPIDVLATGEGGEANSSDMHRRLKNSFLVYYVATSIQGLLCRQAEGIAINPL